jgi:hypothetical protein
MSVAFDFSVCRVFFAPAFNLIVVVRGSAEKAEKFKAISGINLSFLASKDVLISDSFLISQISGDNGKHSAMICELCLKKLNSAYWLRARMQIAEESCFVFYRN